MNNLPYTTQYLIEKWSKCELVDSGSINKDNCILLESEPYQVIGIEPWEALHHKDGSVTPITDKNRDEILGLP